MFFFVECLVKCILKRVYEVGKGKKSGCTMYTLLGRIVKRELPFLNRISSQNFVL